jgi:hypothetical protein
MPKCKNTLTGARSSSHIPPEPGLVLPLCCPEAWNTGLQLPYIVQIGRTLAPKRGSLTSYGLFCSHVRTGISVTVNASDAICWALFALSVYVCGSWQDPMN